MPNRCSDLLPHLKLARYCIYILFHYLHLTISPAIVLFVLNTIIAFSIPFLGSFPNHPHDYRYLDICSPKWKHPKKGLLKTLHLKSIHKLHVISPETNHSL